MNLAFFGFLRLANPNEGSNNKCKYKLKTLFSQQRITQCLYNPSNKPSMMCQLSSSKILILVLRFHEAITFTGMTCSSSTICSSVFSGYFQHLFVLSLGKRSKCSTIYCSSFIFSLHIAAYQFRPSTSSQITMHGSFINGSKGCSVFFSA